MVIGFEPPPGEPGALDRAASALGELEDHLRAQVTSFQHGCESALGTWRGPRSRDFRYAVTGLHQVAGDTVGSIGGAADALAAHAAELRKATDEIADLRQQALQREREGAHEAGGLPANDPQAMQARQHADAAIELLREQADEVRRRLHRHARTAAAALDGICEGVLPGATTLTPEQVARRVHARSGVHAADAALAADDLSAADVWAILEPLRSLGEAFVDQWGGFKPPDDMGPVSGALYALGLTGTGAGLATDTMLKGLLQDFQPRGPLGTWGPVGRGAFSQPGLSFWQRLAAANTDTSWKAKPYQAITRDRWATGGKWIGRAGTALTAASSAWDEWSQDQAYPTDERAGRAVTKGVSTAAGAWAGAEGGAWVGGAIGTAICPGAGTVIGGFVGGVIGGFAGSEVGSWVGDEVKDIGGTIGDKTGDAVDALGDAASKLKFW
ncbi:MAG TPA: hypothetical protein VHO29_15015 [Marmoricola sp.]|nr:hypothetical protein [Marmoricola sp.]